jgi:D-aspartate ligase
MQLPRGGQTRVMTSTSAIGEHQSASALAPIMLCNAGYYGTLAALRSLGRAGVPVVTVDPSVLSPGRFSKYSRLHLRCPPFEQTNEWVEWLLRLNKSGPRRAIYATSDAVSFALASRRDELEASFRLYQPDLKTMMRLLDKGRLLEDARAVGISTPETWLPASRRDAERIAREISGPILVKPRSQLSVRTLSKGIVTDPGASARLAEYDRLTAQTAQDTEFARRYPEAMLPMFQRYHPEGMTAIYSLSGFRDISGKHVAMLGARKVLQRPRRLGVGLCFEEAPLHPDLASRAVQLCERIGYYGVFELEFIYCGGQALLIDFNGRFYNQMLFDMARGLDLPGLVYAAAMGNEADVARLVSSMPAERERGLTFCDGFGFGIAIGSQRVFRTMSGEEASRWRQWRNDPGRRFIDAVRDRGDPIPAAIDIAKQLFQCMRHPRAFVRQTGLAR